LRIGSYKSCGGVSEAGWLTKICLIFIPKHAGKPIPIQEKHLAGSQIIVVNQNRSGLIIVSTFWRIY
jgi:hypothetical protein